MFEQRFFTALALSLGTIALTVSGLAVLDDATSAADEGVSCGLEPVPEVGISVLSCPDPYDVDRSRVWAVWTHGGHCAAQPATPAGAPRIACDSGVTFSLDASPDASWRRCSVEVTVEVDESLSSDCHRVR